MESINAYQSLTDYLFAGSKNKAGEDVFPSQRDSRADREPHLTLARYDTARELNGLYGINPRKD